MAKYDWSGFVRLGGSWKPLLEGITTFGARWGGIIRDIAVGGKNKAGGFVGGLAGIGQSILNTSASLTGRTVETVGAIYKRFPVLAGFATAFAAYAGIKSWFRGRGEKNALREMQAANNLTETRLVNADMQSALTFDGANTGINYPADPNFHRNNVRGNAPGMVRQPAPRP